jgi:hypothetical protein
MNSNTIRNIAIVGTSIAAAVLLYKYLRLNSLVDGVRENNKKAVNSAHSYLQDTYHDRVKTLLDTCVDSGMTEDTFERICDLMDCPL